MGERSTACQAPQLSKNANGVVRWDNDMSFKPIPADQLARGEKLCSKLGKQAVGYHPEAKDLQGKVFVGGGFHCKDTAQSKAMYRQSNSADEAAAILASGGDLSMEMSATAAGNDGYTVIDGVVYENNPM